MILMSKKKKRVNLIKLSKKLTFLFLHKLEQILSEMVSKIKYWLIFFNINNPIFSFSIKFKNKANNPMYEGAVFFINNKYQPVNLFILEKNLLYNKKFTI
ncbi:hypothetical protein BpHYR1_044270 [Brachionus plicatilis]|uniref:Uncharacterized protein n=1 Tax=Brachionus plicatilis TaxID=10195 RepID=A0A3M7RFE1_BRAPC|nr:hypothetical protein BpHYR1_044270 [Brachionus plicatilis]